MEILFSMPLALHEKCAGLLTNDPKDQRHKNQKPFLDFMMQTFGMLVPLADSIGGESKDRVPVNRSLRMSSAFLDRMAEALEEFFQAFGPQRMLLTRTGGWYWPAYPFSLQDLAREKEPPTPRKGTAKTKS